MYILGIHCGHDASAAIVKDGEIIAVIQQERKSRIKHQNGFPKLGIEEVLKIANITADDVDYVAVSGFDRRLESLREFFYALKGRKFYLYGGILKRIKTVISENTKMYFRFRYNLRKLGLQGKKIRYFEHHLCHAASAYRTSGFKKALILTIDGVGDDVSATINIGDGGEITRIAETKPENSIGFLYQAVTEAIGFMPVEGEYKTMGYAALGDQSKLYDYFSGIMSYENLGFKSKYVWESEWKFPAPTISQHLIFRKLLDDYKKEDIAAGCQAVTEDLMYQYVKGAVEKTEIRDVCASGGVFLNVKANKLIREKAGLNSFYIHPDSGDAGLALGAALELYYQLTKIHPDKQLKHTYFGSEYSNEEIEEELKKYNVKYSYFGDIEKKTAEVLAEGTVAGWFQGRMEMGPRALGDRSVLADSRNPKVKERINGHLKRREWFVPFAPSMLEEDANLYIEDLKEDAPFMIMAYNAVKEKKDVIPAVVHVDDTLRPQIVHEGTNPKYYKLLKHFKDLTGVGVIVNTSFNRHGLPIVESPKDAIQHLLDNNVDVLVMGNYFIERV